MAKSARQEFADRLIDAMLDAGYRSARNAKSGVDVGPLAKVAKVTREMARRYTEGTAIPDADRLKVIAEWLGVRLAWLRDGEGAKQPDNFVAKERQASYDVLTAEAREVALAWSKLSPEVRATMRDVIFMLSLGERRFPWLRRGRPAGETYDEWERRQEQNFSAMVKLELDRKTKAQT
jgi:transcriptional regulator with XRE-family HTH domain